MKKTVATIAALLVLTGLAQAQSQTKPASQVLRPSEIPIRLRAQMTGFTETLKILEIQGEQLMLAKLQLKRTMLNGDSVPVTLLCLSRYNDQTRAFGALEQSCYLFWSQIMSYCEDDEANSRAQDELDAWSKVQWPRYQRLLTAGELDAETFNLRRHAEIKTRLFRRWLEDRAKPRETQQREQSYILTSAPARLSVYFF